VVNAAERRQAGATLSMTALPGGQQFTARKSIFYIISGRRIADPSLKRVSR
jgi:hypothetical protein